MPFMKFQKDISLKSLNTFGIDVRSGLYAEFHSGQELEDLLSEPETQGRKILILGGGSNILFSADYPGVILHNRIPGIGIAADDENTVLIKAGGGVRWHSLVLWAVDNGYGGLENLSLIPGSVGAAPIQNIGAYGAELKNTFIELEAMETATGQVKTFSNEQCRFGYRDSIFKQEAKGKFAILSVSVVLMKNPTVNTRYGAIEEELHKMKVTNPGIKEVSEAVISIRRSKLPNPEVIGNAGSFFKNPVVPTAFYESMKSKFTSIPGYPAGKDKTKLAAGWLIEQCGWKGKRLGNVGMHDRQALVLVNYGGASGPELLAHARMVMQSVMDTFGVELEMEVNIV